jgi:hypothetical protein
MNARTQSANELFRILLFRNDATEILLETTWEGFRLPVMPIPPHRRVAEELTAAIRSTWNLETYCLFPLPNGVPPHASVHDQVIEICHPEAETPASMQWFTVDLLSAESFQSPSDFAAIGKSHITLGQHRRNELPGAFAKPDWLRTVTEWVEVQASYVGLRVTGKFRQLNASPSFSLLRFETDGPAVWFKAVGVPNQREYSITLTLARDFSRFVPEIIATKPDCNGWLSREAEGPLLHERSELASWEAVAADLAELQIDSLGRGSHLLAAGARDLRRRTLTSLVDPFFSAVAELMEQQAKNPPAPLSREGLRALASQVRGALALLEETDTHACLGHLDLNPGNIICSADGSVFLDWAEAFVGPPFLTFEYLREHFRRVFGPDCSNERKLVAQYLRPWRMVVSEKQARRALEVTPLAAIFACAVGNDLWTDPRKLEEPRTAGYLRSLTRRMEREARGLSEPSVPCPS